MRRPPDAPAVQPAAPGVFLLRLAVDLEAVPDLFRQAADSAVIEGAVRSKGGPVPLLLELGLLCQTAGLLIGGLLRGGYPGGIPEMTP